MKALINASTRVLVQGLTGKEGRRAADAMRSYGTQVVCGVTPGKGGTEIDGIPVYHTVAEALAAHPEVTCSDVYVPPLAAKAAAREALAAGIPFVKIMTERMPIRDAAVCLADADERGARILGPSSLGVIVPGVGRLGVLGGPLVREIYSPGTIGVMSRSGGMTNELSWNLRQAGLGQSTAVHIGGDVLIGTTYADLLELFERDEATKAVVLFGEQGGRFEFAVAEMVAAKRFTKPIAACIGGAFATRLPEGAIVGHAGALVAKGQAAADKKAALVAAGVMIAERFNDLVDLVKHAVPT